MKTTNHSEAFIRAAGVLPGLSPRLEMCSSEHHRWGDLWLRGPAPKP